MAIAAHLYRDSRWADRHSVEIDATLRDPAWSPVDVIVEDLSDSGFRVLAATELPIGAEIGLGLSGVGLRPARVVRHAGNPYVYGCEFLSPLTKVELQAAIEATPLDPIALPFAARAPDVATQEAAERLPLPTRMLVIAAAAVGAWALLISLGWAIIALARMLLS